MLILVVSLILLVILFEFVRVSVEIRTKIEQEIETVRDEVHELSDRAHSLSSKNFAISQEINGQGEKVRDLQYDCIVGFLRLMGENLYPYKPSEFDKKERKPLIERFLQARSRLEVQIASPSWLKDMRLFRRMYTHVWTNVDLYYEPHWRNPRKK